MPKENYDCYINGTFKSYKNIHVWLVANGLNYATSVIESIRLHKREGSVVCMNLDLYVERFFNGLEENHFSISESPADIKKIITYLLKLNPQIENPYIRVIAYLGDRESVNTMSKDIHLGVYLMSLWNVGKTELIGEFSTFLRHHSYLNTMKLSCNYARNISEQRKFQSQGKDIVIFLWENKEILECVSENIFILKDNILYTPKIGNIVNGVNRRMVLEIVKRLWTESREILISQDFILQADEIFVTGTATGIRNIIQVSDHIIKGKGYTKKIREMYQKIVKEEEVFEGIYLEKII